MIFFNRLVVYFVKCPYVQLLTIALTIWPFISPFLKIYLSRKLMHPTFFNVYFGLSQYLSIALVFLYIAAFFYTRQKEPLKKTQTEKMSKNTSPIVKYRMYWDRITKLPYCLKCRVFMNISDRSPIPNFFCPGCHYVPSSSHKNPDHINAHHIMEIMRKELSAD